MVNSEPTLLDLETAHTFNTALNILEERGQDTGPIRRTKRSIQDRVLDEIEERHEALLRITADSVRLGAPNQEDLYGVNWANIAAQEYEAGLRDQVDLLTGLPTGGYFEMEMERELAQLSRNKKHHGLLFLDLNGFKGINTYYKDVMRYGDRIIQIFASALRASVRKGDLLARRQAGGDEFLVLLHSMDPTVDNEVIVQKILRNLFTTVRDQIKKEGLVWDVNDPEGNPILLEDGIPLFASFGLKMCRPNDEQTVAQAMAQAEIRAFAHKEKMKAGRG